MQYTVGQRLRWEPDYFKWDVPAEVEVVRLYPRGLALLSNGYIADADGVCEWRRVVAGRVTAQASLLD